MAAQCTGAELAIRQLLQSGLDACFANPGTTEMWFVSALEANRGVRTILGLHETVCTGAADGYARMARRPALSLLHLGPGLANGTCNLHNARRARSPVINIIGTMATWHTQADALLQMDEQALSACVSGATITVQDAASISACVQQAVAVAVGGAAAAGKAAGGAAGCPGSRVATLLFPHDVSWASVEVPVQAAGRKPAQDGDGSSALQASPGAQRFMRECAAAIRARPRGKVALYLGGEALLADGGALANAGRIAAHTGAALLCESAFARLDRGAGLPCPRRLPYFPQDAAAELARYELLVAVDARLPVATFGYRGGPSRLVALPEECVWEVDAGSMHIPAALELLARELGAQAVQPLVSCRGVFCPPARPALPTGRLTAAAMCAVVAALQPEGCVLVDESLTSGNAYWEACKGCPQFSHLTLTGGAIGSGPPLAVGAAVACPSRQVINLQADGSAMYSLQALWTQAREGLQVLTIVCANSSYAILKVEAAKQRIPGAGGAVTRGLTELGQPQLDFESLARGMGVAAGRARSCEELAAEMRRGLAARGPYLIQADL